MLITRVMYMNGQHVTRSILMMDFDLQRMTVKKTKISKKRKMILMSVTLLSQKMAMGNRKLKII